ncbi:hypothetical protein N7520_005033 [Penicillium odoratum]|uniref:uncharacterized protein n=1 Tax=Penicillium odoratum TaxID=1167516 RepID=UPI00254764D1|nr:uncharacterized protein N7520_005033 [Penicillium odoratum]KAJ5765474.1 hypothetical protein N7520_005033 [Penicillium odoratum]
MVGVPRSSGCRVCVKRRVKCDERVPGCAKCETYGQPCPGYDKGFKFIAGKPYRTPRRPPGIDNARPNIPSPGSSSSSPITETQLLIQREIPHSPVSVDVNVLQSLSALIEDFSFPRVLNAPSYVVASWFEFLPSIYGQSRALDATIKSFAAHHFGRGLQNQDMVIYARSAYGEALHWLRKALMNPSESLSSNIFCAVVLLCMYELFTDTEDPESWMKHAKGLGQLVQARGPERYNNQLDISLLKSARGLIVMHSMFAGEDCFLASEEWHRMMQQQHLATLPLDYHNCIEKFFAYFTHSPRIVHNLYRLREKDYTNPVVMMEISQALAQVLDMQNKMASWYNEWSQVSSPPIEALSTTGDELFPIILTYADLVDASVYCGYYAYMIIIHEALKTFGYPGPQETMVSYFRDQICRSIEYTAFGALGPYRIGFPVRVAIETADDVTRSWLLARLKEFSKTYAAAKPENYKPIM